MPDALARCAHCGFVHSVLYCDVGEGISHDMARQICADTLPEVLVDSDVFDAADWLAGNIPAGVTVAAPVAFEMVHGDALTIFEIDLDKAAEYFRGQKFSG
jgi:hypothetical protein